ncbi:MAG TPA: aminodeoxychorismate synthase component I, partial [Oxalicibacterium sp.]|nr:aminodeoxychorismate synthase component I [Oxalicibacterium sp.]
MPAPDCFALLDDCEATAAAPHSRLYSGHVATLSCTSREQLPTLLEQMQQALRAGQYALGLFDYELGAAMHDIAPREGQPMLAEVLLFAHCEQLSSEQVALWLGKRISAVPAGV